MSPVIRGLRGKSSDTRNFEDQPRQTNPDKAITAVQATLPPSTVSPLRSNALTRPQHRQSENEASIASETSSYSGDFHASLSGSDVVVVVISNERFISPYQRKLMIRRYLAICIMKSHS